MNIWCIRTLGVQDMQTCIFLGIKMVECCSRIIETFYMLQPILCETERFPQGHKILNWLLLMERANANVWLLFVLCWIFCSFLIFYFRSLQATVQFIICSLIFEFKYDSKCLYTSGCMRTSPCHCVVVIVKCQMLIAYCPPKWKDC